VELETNWPLTTRKAFVRIAMGAACDGLPPFVNCQVQFAVPAALADGMVAAFPGTLMVLVPVTTRWLGSASICGNIHSETAEAMVVCVPPIWRTALIPPAATSCACQLLIISRLSEARTKIASGAFMPGTLLVHCAASVARCALPWPLTLQIAG
jgi:hypothetical protein